jgi:penicillin-binding protein 1A
VPRWLRRFIAVTLSVVFVGVAVLVGAVVWHFWRVGARLPSRSELAAMTPERLACGRDAIQRPISLALIPSIIADAFVAVEDKTFWERPPFNLLRDLVNAAILGSRPTHPGISMAVTQTVVLCTHVGPRPAGQGEMHVANLIMIHRLERELPKARILELYLNLIYLGRGAYGVAAAADAYFGKSLTELTLGEAAFLVALSRSPSRYRQRPDRVLELRNWMLDQLAEAGRITSADAAAAKAEPLKVRPQSHPQ